jgi:hypothetical protein
VSAPRILYTEPDLRGIDADASQVLLWPCHMFTVALPKRQQRTLNIFEETVLRLAGAGYTDAEDLARLTCLEKEMVASILRRLAGLRYLDSSLRPLRGPQDGPEPGEASWESAHVFVDLIGGRLLPCMSYGTPEYAESLDADGGKFRFGRKQLGATRLDHGRDYVSRVPSPREVHAVARIRMRQDARRAGAEGAHAAVPVFDTPTIMDGVDKVYLAVSAVLQTGNHDEVLLMDPFGFGPCGTLSEVFRQVRTSHASIRKSAQALLEGARVAGLRREGATARKAASRYPEVAGKIRKSNDALEAAQAQVIDSEGAAKAERATSHCLRALYEAIELALHAVVLERPPGKGLRELLANQPFDANGDLLWSYASKLGLRGGDRERKLLQVAPGKFRERGAMGVELAPLLALALGAACGERDGSHPLRAVAEAHPGWLTFILRLKGYRDSVAHGKAIPGMHRDVLEAYHAQACGGVSLLLPDLRGQPGPTDADDDARWRNQARLRARLAASAVLAPASFDHLPDDLRKACIELELLRDSESGREAGVAVALPDEPEAAAIVNALATMLQLALEECLGARPASARSAGDWYALAREKALVAGFELRGGCLPEPLRRVARHRLAAAMRGGGATLQSGAMALLILADDNYLNELARKLPGLLSLAGDLAALRGHGHQTRPVTWTELEQLRELVYRSITYLTEI